MGSRSENPLDPHTAKRVSIPPTNPNPTRDLVYPSNPCLSRPTGGPRTHRIPPPQSSRKNRHLRVSPEKSPEKSPAAAGRPPATAGRRPPHRAGVGPPKGQHIRGKGLGGSLILLGWVSFELMVPPYICLLCNFTSHTNRHTFRSNDAVFHFQPKDLIKTQDLLPVDLITTKELDQDPGFTARGLDHDQGS